MSIMDSLITDRTAADAAARNDKGTYNAADLNRVSAAMEFAAQRLRGYGYEAELTPPLPLGPQKGRLPAGYTELAFIGSTGTQYIDTGVMPNQDTRAVCDAQLTAVSGTVSFLGQRYTSATQAFGWISVNGSLRSYYNAQFTVVATADTARHLYDKDKNVTRIDGETVHTADYAAFDGDFPLYLFAGNEQGTAGLFAQARLYACKIYASGVLIRDFVPCRRHSDGAAGLYDRITGAFYGNSGTGSFEEGPEIPALRADENILKNLIENGDFSGGLSGWTLSGDAFPDGGSVRFVPSGGVSMLTCPMPAPEAGHRYYGRVEVKSTAAVTSSDNRFEWYHSDAPGDLLTFAAKTGDFPQWTALSSVQSVPSVMSQTGWSIRNFFVGLSGGDVWVTRQMIVDLTAAYGAGSEPDKAWCDAHIPYISGTQVLRRTEWLMGDIPTQAQMQQYLNNLAVLRGALAAAAPTPPVPGSMEHLTWQQANDIERILQDVDAMLTKMAAAWFESGELYAGEVNP